MNFTKFTEKKVGVSTFVFLLLCAVIISSLSTYFILNDKLKSGSKSISEKEQLVAKLLKADELVTKRYAGTMPASVSLVDGLLSGYMNSLGDRFALYMNKENYRAYNSISTGLVSMLGIISSYNGSVEGISVDYVMNDSAAAKKDIRKGDIITKVGGIAVTQNNYFVLLNSLMGKEGSEADLQINRNGEILSVTVKLRQSALQSASSYFFNELGIGGINIAYFGDKTYAEFESCLKGVLDEGPAGLVLDLRGCAGGDIEVAAKVLDRLLPAGTMFTEKESADATEETVSGLDGEKTYISDDNSVSIPIVVLTDEYTKGAAEIFAAVLKGYNYPIVGSKTFGNTKLQDVVNLGDETAIMFSAFSYKNSKGEEISGMVEPTDAVELADELTIKLPNLDSNSDAQLAQALTHFTPAAESSSSATASAKD